MTHFKTFLLLSFLFIQSCTKPDLVTSDNSKIYLDDLKGKLTLINYWADWCPPCIKEIPELNKLKNNFSSQVNVFLFNFDRLEGEELSEQLVKFKVEVPSLLTDPKKIFGYIVPEALPVSFIIDENGQYLKTLKGPQTLDSLKIALEIN
ncbi:MAG: TlpA family protein disulfide reductase [Gammaproteobacteria bacterium]|tara:strand:- start:210 stop:656 length:447 start_codon:yes stop_codon:yes gene_type:complete